VDQKVREYRAWSIEYREIHRFGWRVAASGGRWREDFREVGSRPRHDKKRHGLEKAIAAESASRSIGQGSHTFLHHASKSNFDLQIADYCCWAIWRSLTKGDHQAMDILGQAVDLQE
jgi:hypothetical protein